MHFKYGDASFWRIRRNNVEILNYTGDTRPEGYSTNLGYIEWTGAAGRFFYLDDVAINDTNGSADNTWPGDGHVIGIKPTGDVSTPQFTRVSSATPAPTQNCQVVDEIPYNANDYIQSATSGDTDFYTHSGLDLSPQDTIKRVWVTATASETSASSDDLQIGVKSLTTEAWTNRTLDLTYRPYRTEEHTVDPHTGQSWTQLGVNNLQFGVKIP